MSKSKTEYDKGLQSLKEALKILREAESHFESSSNNMDDFPTARHEIMEVADNITQLCTMTRELYQDAYDNRIR